MPDAAGGVAQSCSTAVLRLKTQPFPRRVPELLLPLRLRLQVP